MSVRKFTLPGIAVTAGVGLTAAALTGTAAAAAEEAPVYLAASLIGRNEVPTQGGPAVGDRDGRALAVLKVQGDRVWYAVRWANVASPTAGQIHLGAKGVNGALKVPFFSGTLPSTAQAATGSVEVTDQAILEALTNEPTGVYANLPTAQFPGGAVRGQFHKLSKPVDLNGVLNGSSQLNLKSLGDGDQDAKAVGLVRASGATVTYAFTWSAIDAPTAGRLNKGLDGPTAVRLFTAPGGLPASLTGLAGAAPARPDVTRRITQNPSGFSTNLATGRSPKGAVRGRLAKATSPHATALTAPVLLGAQIYRCTQQQGGTFSYVQDNVSAVLTERIKHTFVQPAAGPPQWVAPDGSAVTGKAVTRIPNGDNIPELVLDATQSGGQAGLLSNATQILRLNTVGGTAPAGPCDPQQRLLAKVRYGADYVFLG